MKKQQNGKVAAQGADTHEVIDDQPIADAAIPGVLDLEKAIRRDAQSAIALLNAILTDADMLNHMAVFVRGRLQNKAGKAHAGEQA